MNIDVLSNAISHVSLYNGGSSKQHKLHFTRIKNGDKNTSLLKHENNKLLFVFSCIVSILVYYTPLLYCNKLINYHVPTVK